MPVTSNPAAGDRYVSATMQGSSVALELREGGWKDAWADEILDAFNNRIDPEQVRALVAKVIDPNHDPADLSVQGTSFYVSTNNDGRLELECKVCERESTGTPEHFKWCAVLALLPGAEREERA